MDHRLLNIAKAVAQTAIDSYNNHATFMYLSHGIGSDAARAVYDELVLGAKARKNPWQLARNCTRVALIAWWRSNRTQINEIKIMYIESNSLFGRSHMATHATLMKMIKETNYQRRLRFAHAM